MMQCPFLKKKEKNTRNLWFKLKVFIRSLSPTTHGYGYLSGLAAANLQAILDTTVDSIITINESCIVKAFNKAAEKMFGYHKEEIIGQNVKILMPEPYHSEHDEYVQNYLRTGEKKVIGIGREVVARRKDGSTFIIDLSVSEVIVSQERLFTAILRDLTGKKEAEKIKFENIRIETEMKAKNSFITMISHELRTPLHAIMGFTECLINEIDGPLNETQKASLQHSYNASQHLLQLVNGVLELSRIATLQAEKKTEKCDLVNNLNACLQTIEPLANQKNIPLVKVLPDKPVYVDANPQHIQQIYFNLLSNAIKFTDHGEITITLNSAQHLAFITIQDTGIGVDPQNLPKIFIPFARSTRNADEQERPGLGLGLAITKQLIELYNGTIEVSSVKNRGTTFRIKLPLFDEQKQRQENATT